MAWPLIFAGISAASGAFSAFDGFRSNRRIRQDLEQIKKYLIGLQRSVEELKAQNVEILRQLDLLPERIGRIVEEIVAVALLQERYSVISDVRDNFLILNGGRGYNIKDAEWTRYSEAMTYLFRYEHRLQRTFDLINVCEVALIITKERAKPMVALRVDEKLHQLQALKDNLERLLITKIEKLKIDLSNTTYIASHNLTPNLGDFNALAYQKHPDRTRTENYTVRKCEPRGGGGGMYGGGGGTECWNENHTRQVPDQAFHNARDRHVAQIEIQVVDIKKDIKEFTYLTLLVSSLSQYRHVISSKGLTEIFAEQKSMYFFDDVEGIDKVETKGVLDWDDVDEYIDGCHGDCESIKGLLIQDDNQVFELNKHC